MSLEPLLAAGWLVTVHALAAVAALVLGAAQLLLQKGGQRHKAVGYLWVLLMTVVALSSFWIHDLRVIGLFSPIHALSVFTLATLVMSVVAVRRGNIQAHQNSMRWLFFAALIGAGAFTFLPGRVMYSVATAQ